MNKKHFILGGDIKKSLTEGYRLDLKSILKDAFVISKKHYLTLILACLLTFVILASSYTLMTQAFSGLGDNGAMIVNYIITLLVAPPLLTALQMMGVHHAIGLKSKSNDLFHYLNMTLKLSLATMMISLITNVISVILTQTLGDLGFKLSIVVLLYLNMTFSLVYPLIAEKKVPPQMALKLSFKLVNKNLGQFTLLFIILVLLAVIALVPYGLGMIFYIPFYFNLMGIVYRQICGVGVVATEVSDKDDTPSDEFEA
ncbi:hypothetical protein [Psychromonas antarctica]|jgi:uncharacterized membrane protein|uniref:hypothetical protein n=1 Tax=Psychromonas antarctica TaxID=67573 RepID=UPI001EE790E8|nr:hypothetical protein [Psychromonas antarctica]MCG6200928.1 hypothetical protein [Psychromonas antarctica]